MIPPAMNAMNHHLPPPVIIAGAGPCGLVAALTLQRESAPFVVVERASRQAISSNVGGGFDMAPTAMGILQGRLSLDLEGVFERSNGICVQDMQGNVLGTSTQVMDPSLIFGTLSRSGLQEILLNTLFPSPQDEEGILFCGSGVQSYETNIDEETVTVTLTDDTKLVGRALLGCDGVHSAVRKTMMKDTKGDAELRFCNAVCYWAKCQTEAGSKLEELVDAVQPSSGVSKKGASTFILALGSTKYPGSFSISKLGNQLFWTFSMKADHKDQYVSRDGSSTGDLIRRGGRVLNEQSKAELERIFEGRSELMQLCLEGTDPASITRVGVYDRKNAKLPYTDGKLVALLGDAAHPQTPFAGQGCNMAITDAYVCAMRLAKHSSNIPKVLESFDTKARRKSVMKVVKIAKSNLDGCVSDGWFMTWLMRFIFKSMLSTDKEDNLAVPVSYDKSNKEFLEALDADVGGVDVVDLKTLYQN